MDSITGDAGNVSKQMLDNATVGLGVTLMEDPSVLEQDGAALAPPGGGYARAPVLGSKFLVVEPQTVALDLREHPICSKAILFRREMAEEEILMQIVARREGVGNVIIIDCCSRFGQASWTLFL